MLRRTRMSGQVIADRLALPRSTVGTVLRKLGLGRLNALDPRPPVIRYEREKPGELIHIDMKKLGRIEGIGHRITGNRRDGARFAKSYGNDDLSKSACLWPIPERQITCQDGL